MSPISPLIFRGIVFGELANIFEELFFQGVGVQRNVSSFKRASGYTLEALLKPRLCFCFPQTASADLIAGGDLQFPIMNKNDTIAAKNFGAIPFSPLTGFRCKYYYCLGRSKLRSNPR